MGEKLNIWFWQSLIVVLVWIFLDRLSIWIDNQHWPFIHGHFVLLLVTSWWLKNTIFKKEKDG